MGPHVQPARDAGSWLHRLSPIPKLAWLVAGVLTAAVTYAPAPLLGITLAALGVAASAGVARRLVRGLLVFLPLGASIILLQALLPAAACRPACETLAAVGPFTVHPEGIAHGLSLAARLLAMQAVTFAVVLTTDAPDLFAALNRLRVPLTASFTASMTLLFVPILRRELELVLGAQRARGLESTGPVALTRALVPVIASSVARLEQVAISLETRGFGGTSPRTSRRVVGFGSAERLLAVVGVAAGVAGIAAGVALWGPGQATVELSPDAAVAVVAVAAAGFGLVVLRAAALVLRA